MTASCIIPFCPEPVAYHVMLRVWAPIKQGDPFCLPTTADCCQKHRDQGIRFSDVIQEESGRAGITNLIKAQGRVAPDLKLAEAYCVAWGDPMVMDFRRDFLKWR